MTNTRRLRAVFLTGVLSSLTLLTACGGGASSSMQVSTSTPQFTSVPVTAAAQGVAYTYQLTATDSAGGMVSFAFTTAPTGATLSGNTITWTPGASQSRVPNSFAVTATTASGGSASQSWTVTPNGTITVNWVNTYWTATGTLQVPESATESLGISAFVANPDGSITVLKSSATSPGVFSIPNVPAGFYWLDIGGVDFWTSTGTFDAGRDLAGPPAPSDNDQQLTLFEFNLSGLDSVPETTFVEFAAPVNGVQEFAITDGANSTTISQQQFGIGTVDTDWSQVTSAFLLQYKPVTLGSLNNQVLDSSLDATLSLTDDTTNTITGTLQQPSNQVFVNLDVPGSQWAALFANSAPSAPTPFASALSISAQEYITGRLASGTVPTIAFVPEFPGPPLTLAGTAYVNSQGSGFGIGPGGPVFGNCDALGFPTFTNSSQPAISTDQDFGLLQYGDPFPSTWTRALSFCEEYMAAIPIPDSTATANFVLVDAGAVAPTASPILAPVVSPVQNPTVNGASLFTATTLNSTVIPLSWSAPTGATPYGYTVSVYVLITLPDGVQSYAAAGGSFSTAQTSITLPPLAGGITYVFAITAQANGLANMETSPYRSSLPTGFASVVSAPITISSGAVAPAIHGDAKALARLSRAQPSQTRH